MTQVAASANSQRQGGKLKQDQMQGVDDSEWD